MLSCQAQKVLRALFNNKATSDLIVELDGGSSRHQFFVHHDVVAAESKLVQQYLADVDDDSDENRAPGSRPIIRLKLPKINSPMKHPDDPPMTAEAYFELYLKYVYGIESPDINYPVRACCIAEIADYMLSKTIKDQCDDVLGEVTVSHSQDRWYVLFFFARRLGLAKTQRKTLDDVLAQFGLDQILASLQLVDAKRFKELILEIPCREIHQLEALIQYAAKLEPGADMNSNDPIVLYDEAMVACLQDVYRAISSRWRTRAVLLEVERLTDRIVFDEWARKGSPRSSCCLYRILSQAMCQLLRDGVSIH